MSRFLFATTPADGHTLPALPIARALIERGHSVRWYTGIKYAERITALGAEYASMSDHDSSVVGVEHFFPARAQLTGLAKLRFDLAVSFTAPTRTHVRDLLELLREEPADLLVGDTGLIAGHMVTELGGPPFAALGITVLGVPSRDLAPFGLGLGPSRNPLSRVRNAALHRLVRGRLFRPMTDAINEIRAEQGLAATADLVFDYPMRGSVYLQLGAEGFEYPRSDLPATVRFVGPTRPLSDPTWQSPEWWPELDSGRPVILVNQGTVATDPSELLKPALAALAGEDALVVAVTGGRDPSELGSVPANARVEPFIPFERLLPHVDVLVTNGGFGAVQLALAAGVPIVAAGQTEDKVEVSARVGWSRAGINLRTQTPRRDFITAAVRQVLQDPRYRRRARELQAEIAATGREDGAADVLEELVASRTGVPSSRLR
jgi:MGT family glycosyltransferase